MKLISIFILISSIYTCSEKPPKFLHGYIYTTGKKPIEGIKIEDPTNKNLFAKTYNKGYFRINSIIKGRYLYVIYKEKKLTLFI
ncbi:hypothetical protein [Flavobacterium columnare]|uniref:Carboxypeptidase regulatory-like domain-containing protein n=1 Tax=Flavobacterium columnare TaxID=996 RepID=A0AA94EYL1_9FLAO|nr:hypothetical protein [Flavobacterium columnare]MCH4828954.1 hypothetical protein [Flavobacterium columnare]MCH4831716.1 hypothetical protein [Flavobacterium columnare]